ncbi:hypothetical protein ACU686_16540 [Yinghuangia aomiensis]
MFLHDMPRRPNLRRRRFAAVAVAAASRSHGHRVRGGSGGGGSAGQAGAATILMATESRGLDPFTATYGAAADSSRMAALYDFLVYLDPASGQVKPRIAESLTPDATGAVRTLKVKPNVRFSDGTYDAAAVKANWDANNDPAMNSIHRV